MAENKRHKGHRQRMRERVQSYGLDSLAEHEALEYVLYLTNAQKDTNGIAHDLIDRFGDFAAVLEASEEELCTVEGVGPSTARMLHLLPQISRYYGRSRTSTTRCIKTTEQMGSYLMAKFAWSDYERAMLVSLDSRKRVRAAVWLREGTSDRVSLDIKNVVAAAIKGGTDAVVLCHNHPNGVALPSLEDMDATGSIARALGLVNVHLLDHFILTDTECFSMRDAGRLTENHAGKDVEVRFSYGMDGLSLQIQHDLPVVVLMPWRPRHQTGSGADQLDFHGGSPLESAGIYT